MTKDEWMQKAKALLFDCTFCVDAPSIRKEIEILLNAGGGYNFKVECSTSKLNWLITKQEIKTQHQIWVLRHTACRKCHDFDKTCKDPCICGPEPCSNCGDISLNTNLYEDGCDICLKGTN